MQRTYLALAMLAAAAAAAGLQNLPLRANTTSGLTSGVTAVDQPPPPPEIAPSEPAGIISLEVVPYTPRPGDS